jgi:hypothetical protein
LSDLLWQSQAQFTVSDLQSQLLETVSAWLSEKIFVLSFFVSLALAENFRAGAVGNLSRNTWLFLCLVFRIFIDALEFAFPHRNMRLKQNGSNGDCEKSFLEDCLFRFLSG